MRHIWSLALLVGCSMHETAWAPDTTNWHVHVGQSREELLEVWPGGAGWTARSEGRTFEVLWLYSVLQPVLLEDDRVAAFAIGTTTDRDGQAQHPDLEGLTIGVPRAFVREHLGEPLEIRRFVPEERPAIEIWSYGRSRPRYLFWEHPESDGPFLMGLVVGL